MKASEAIAIIEQRIAKIETDERYKSGRKNPAIVDTNAPLALIQLAFETEVRTLKWVKALLELP